MNTRITKLVNDDRIHATYEICLDDAYIPYCEYRHEKDFNTKLRYYGNIIDFAHIMLRLVDKYYPFEKFTADDFYKFFIDKLQNRYEDA